MFSERRARRNVVRSAREMRARGLVTVTTGNLSVRTARGMLITPTRRAYETLRPRDLVHIDLDGKVLNGGTPSIEWPVHAAIYRARPSAGSIMHTHSPWATARGFEPTALEVRTEERSYYGLESVPVVANHEPGSPDLAWAVGLRARTARVLLLARHGVIATAASPSEALELCALVEHLAQVDLLVTITERHDPSLTKTASVHG